MSEKAHQVLWGTSHKSCGESCEAANVGGERPSGPTPFPLTSGSISSLFAQYCRALGIKGLHFHDTRRLATIRMVAKLKDPMLVSKILGHKDPRITYSVYYAADMADIARKL